MSETGQRVRALEESFGQLRLAVDAIVQRLERLEARLDNMEASNKRLAEYVGRGDAVTATPEPRWAKEDITYPAPWTVGPFRHRPSPERE